MEWDRNSLATALLLVLMLAPQAISTPTVVRALQAAWPDYPAEQGQPLNIEAAYGALYHGGTVANYQAILWDAEANAPYRHHSS